MKLILFLVAIYSLIFFQRYKINKPGTTLVVPQEVANNKEPYRYPVAHNEEERRNTKISTRTRYPVSGYYKAEQFPLARFALYK